MRNIFNDKEIDKKNNGYLIIVLFIFFITIVGFAICCFSKRIWYNCLYVKYIYAGGCMFEEDVKVFKGLVMGFIILVIVNCYQS